MISFRSVLDRHEAGEVNQVEAGELLGISELTFRRWCRRDEQGGEAGSLDRRRAVRRPNGRRWTMRRRSNISIGPATVVSWRGTATTSWCVITRAAGAIPGRSCSCNRKACWSQADRVKKYVTKP